MKAYAFFHIATMGGYQRIVDELLDCVMGSGLIDKLESLYCGVCGDKPVRLPVHPKISQERLQPTVTKFEYPTLQKVQWFSKYNPGAAVLYFHTKGAAHADNQCINDWRNYMAYFCIEQWRTALNQLECFDTAGVDFEAFHIDSMACTSESITQYGRDLHYSGNYWWANSDYLARLPDLDDTKDRHAAEFWIGKGKGAVHCCMWNCRIPILARQYFRYPRHFYAQETANA